MILVSSVIFEIFEVGVTISVFIKCGHFVRTDLEIHLGAFEEIPETEETLFWGFALRDTLPGEFYGVGDIDREHFEVVKVWVKTVFTVLDDGLDQVVNGRVAVGDMERS